jgi:hypothetical protein
MFAIMSAFKLNNIDPYKMDKIRDLMPRGIDIVEDTKVNDQKGENLLIGEIKYSAQDESECVELDVHKMLEHSISPLMYQCRMILLKEGIDLYPKLYLLGMQDLLVTEEEMIG